MSARLRFLGGDPALRDALGSAAAGSGRLGRRARGAARAARASASCARAARQRRPGVPQALRPWPPPPTRSGEGVRSASRRRGASGGRWSSLHARGVLVPEPLALAAMGGGDFVIATRFFEGRTLKQTLAEQPAKRRALLHAVGDLVASLHAAGWTHGDLHHGNLLVGAGGVWLLDLQAALPLRAASARWRDLGELDHSLAGSLSVVDRVRLRARALGLCRPFSDGARRSLRGGGTRFGRTRARLRAQPQAPRASARPALRAATGRRARGIASATDRRGHPVEGPRCPPGRPRGRAGRA